MYEHICASQQHLCLNGKYETGNKYDRSMDSGAISGFYGRVIYGTAQWGHTAPLSVWLCGVGWSRSDNR